MQCIGLPISLTFSQITCGNVATCVGGNPVGLIGYNHGCKFVTATCNTKRGNPEPCLDANDNPLYGADGKPLMCAKVLGADCTAFYTGDGTYNRNLPQKVITTARSSVSVCSIRPVEELEPYNICTPQDPSYNASTGLCEGTESEPLQPCNGANYDPSKPCELTIDDVETSPLPTPEDIESTPQNPGNPGSITPGDAPKPIDDSGTTGNSPEKPLGDGGLSGNPKNPGTGHTGGGGSYTDPDPEDGNGDQSASWGDFPGIPAEGWYQPRMEGGIGGTVKHAVGELANTQLGQLAGAIRLPSGIGVYPRWTFDFTTLGLGKTVVEPPSWLWLFLKALALFYTGIVCRRIIFGA
jgi:hypothetical protein